MVKYCMKNYAVAKKTVLLSRKIYSKNIKPRETMQGIYGSNFNNSHDIYLRRILHYYLQTAIHGT
jgi:hypothetical protein